MESCCSHLTPSQQHNSFRIDNILTGIGQTNNTTFNLVPPPHKSEPSGKTFVTMFCKNEDLSGGALSHELKRESVSSMEEDEDGYRKKKKPRTAFSREQVAELEKKFTERKYLSSAERGELAQKLNLSDMQVKTWFQNRRMKFKRQTEEAELEVKSPKFPYPPFVPAAAYSSFYSYMPYKGTTDPMSAAAVYGCTSPPTADPYTSSLVLSSAASVSQHLSPPPHPPPRSSYHFNAATSAGHSGPIPHSYYQLGSYFNGSVPTGTAVAGEYTPSNSMTSQYSNGGGEWSGQRSSLSSPPSAP